MKKAFCKRKKMHVRVRGTRKHKKFIRVGDPVSIHSMPGETPRSRVDVAFQPVVAAFRRVGRSKLATVKYTDTEDGQQHLMELPAASMRGGSGGSEDPLQIGDHVVLRSRGAGVLPAVG